MVGLCVLCRVDRTLFPNAPVRHCYGKGDNPPPRGTFGGFRCSCECRHKPEKRT